MSQSFHDFSLSLQHQTLSVEEILSSNQLQQALSTHFHPIFQSISQTNILLKLLEWCFSTKYINDMKFSEYSNASISIFCAAATNNSEFLKNQILDDFLYNFLRSEDSKNPKLTGHFSRLFINNLESFSYLIEQYNQFITLLISRIESIGMQDLIVTFVKSGIVLSQCHLIISELIKISKTSDVACLTISSIYRALPKEMNLVRKEFFSQSLISNLADAAIATNSCFTKAELAYVITDVVSIDRSLNEFTEDQISSLKISKDNITTLSIGCIDIFYRSCGEQFQFFFLDERLHYQLIKKIQLTSEAQIIEIAKIPNFVDTLINYYGTNKWCYHCSKIAMEFGSLSATCNELQSERWLSFYKQNIAEKTEILSNEYGGSTPQPISSTEIALMRQLQMPFKFSPSVKMTIELMSKGNDRYNSNCFHCDDMEIEKEYEEDDDLAEDQFNDDEDSGEEFAIDI